MRNFFRVLKLSWAYSPRILLSVLMAMAVAVLWSLNLSAIYPVLTVLADDKSLQSWVEKEIKKYQEKVNNEARATQIEHLKQLNEKLVNIEDFRERKEGLKQNTQTLAALQAEVEHDTKWLGRYRLLEWWVIRHLPEGRFAQFVWIMIGILIATILKGICEFWQDTLVGSVVNRTVFDLRNRVFRLAVHQDVRQVQESGTADMMARVTNDLEQVGAGMKILFGKMVVEPLKALGCLFMAFAISWQLSLLFLILAIPAAIVIGRISRSMKKASRKVLEGMTDLYRIAREAFDGIKVLKAFTMETSERRRFRSANEGYYRRSMRVLRIDAFAGPIVEIFGLLAVGMALLAGAYLVMEKQTGIDFGFFKLTLSDDVLSFKALLQLYVCLGMVADPVRRLSSVYSKIQTGAAAADRVYFLADKVPKVTANAEGPAVPRHSQTIEFMNVCFSYVPGLVPGTLNNVDLTVRAGETIAIVGPNGCGKTTLLGLIPRFYDPDYGAVQIDGVNIRHARLRSLRKQIGLVTQDTILFNDTIAANIAYGRPGATREQVEAAAKQAFAHEFIITRPHSYEELAGDAGSQLSGGQKQRIALARAILRDPAILILDEFTSQIDSESEAKIHQALKDFVKGRTTFMITHRLNTLELADRIVVMDHGRIVAVGAHSELLRDCEVYTRLYEATFKTVNDKAGSDGKK